MVVDQGKYMEMVVINVFYLFKVNIVWLVVWCGVYLCGYVFDFIQQFVLDFKCVDIVNVFNEVNVQV